MSAPREKERDLVGEVDRCLYDDGAIKKSIKERESILERALKLLPSDYSDSTPEQVAAYASIAPKLADLQEAIELDKARVDFNSFAERVMIDDESGQPIRQAPIHRRWAELCSQHKRLLIWSSISSGKSTQLSILRNVWELGRDPTLRCVILSNTAGIATKLVKSISALIKTNERLKKVFPHLEPDTEGVWTQTELQVKRNSHSKDPSIRAVGVHGSLTSARVDRLTVDDILDPEVCETEAARKKLESWYRAVAVGRMTKRSRILIVGTAYHQKDLLHTIAQQKGWVWKRFPVMTESGVIAWPEAWSKERIDSMRQELGPAEAARQLYCKARDDDEARFKQADIDRALELGRGLKLVRSAEEIPEEQKQGARFYTGVDLGVKRDKTAFFTFMEDEKGFRTVLEIEKGHYTGPEIVDKVVSAHHRFGSFVSVENNAAQQFILDFARDISSVPVVPHTTTRSKRDPVLGVEGLAIELSNGKWRFPNVDGKMEPEIEEFVNALLFYTPVKHVADEIMAGYFARELARRHGGGRANVPQAVVRVVSEAPSDPNDQETYREGVSLKKLFDVPSGP